MRVWIASLLFYFAIFALCELLRYLVKKYFESKKGVYDKLGETIAYEFIGTVQVCAPMFDVNFVLDTYGLSGVLFEIALIEVVNAFLLRDAIADPCPLFHGFLKGKKSFAKFLTLLAVQFTAGYVSFMIARMFWSLGLHRNHSEMLEQKNCNADLTVTILYGSIVEATGLFVNKLAEVAFEKNELTSNYISLACALTSGLITVIGIHLTGMYANPIVAWACTFNCGEVSHVAHFCVYWLAPFSAFVCADRLLHNQQEHQEAEENKKLDKNKQ